MEQVLRNTEKTRKIQVICNIKSHIHLRIEYKHEVSGVTFTYFSSFVQNHCETVWVQEQREGHNRITCNDQANTQNNEYFKATTIIKPDFKEILPVKLIRESW